MRIHRSHPDANFTIIPNATLRDQRLSGLAKSILVELLSHADGWKTNADALWHQALNSRGEKSGEGRRPHRAALKELEEYGYLVRRKVRGPQGRVVTEFELHDTPGHHGTVTEQPNAEKLLRDLTDRGTSSGTSSSGTSESGTSKGGTSLRSTNQRSTKEEVLSEEHSSGLAVARPGALTSAANRTKSPWDLVDEQRRAEEERDRIINGTAAAKRPPKGMDAIDTSNVEQGNQALDALYKAVGGLSDEQLRNALLAFEAKRPLIYRACRNHTFEDLNGEDRRVLKGQVDGREADMLSYKYALLHYYNTAQRMPTWLIKPLQARRRKAA